jgi:hypothetical protein
MSMEWPRGEMCKGCAGRQGTDANQSAETMNTFRDCIKTGEPFYCHESTAVEDPEGSAVDKHGTRFRCLPENRWRLCRAWMNATRQEKERLDRQATEQVKGFGRMLKGILGE